MSSSVDRLTSLILCHRSTNWLISSVEVIRCNPLVYFLSCSPSATELFFLQASLYRFGAMSLGHSPCNHMSCQKLTFLPFPKQMEVHALNKLFSISLCMIFMFPQGLFGSFHLNHCHLKCKVILNFDKSKTPRPPSFLGLCTLFQLIRQLTFLVSSDSYHRKFLLILSIFLIAHLDRGKTIM
jgi:hypothetical protein